MNDEITFALANSENIIPCWFRIAHIVRSFSLIEESQTINPTMITKSNQYLTELKYEIDEELSLVLKGVWETGTDYLMFSVYEGPITQNEVDDIIAALYRNLDYIDGSSNSSILDSFYQVLTAILTDIYPDAACVF